LVTALNKTSGNLETSKGELEVALAEYGEIGVLASELERLSNALMIQEVDILKERVQNNKKALIWQVSGLIGFSVLLVVLFISLINKPVSQLDRGIERLGEGDFSTPISVFGPRDLEAIGAKLDWLRKRLDTLDREKVRMLAHISHELKTPLSSIKEGAGLLKDGLVGPLSKNQTEVVTILDNNCNKLQKLIQNILDFNMAQANEIPLDLQDVRVDTLIVEVVEDHRNAMFARNISLATKLEPVTVSGNRKQLKAVVDNLLANAVKFTQDNGDIGIYMKLKGNKVNILVEDTGPGISEEDRPQIFLPFFQGSQKNRSVVKGSGLGLAISKEYIQNFGGTLRLLPSSQGARFSVTLPCAKDGAR
jgi:two-component system sensor histidine kinase GlrK